MKNNEQKNEKKVLRIKVFTSIILMILFAFILFNIVIFGKIIVREAKGTINKDARMYLASAYAINNIYIIPLSRSFGFLSPVTKPFYMTRNFLYKKGMNKLATNDGEREWWWFRIREQEFVNLYMKAMFDWNYKNILTKNKADDLLRMEDEVYTHLLNIPKAKPYDKSLAKEKYFMFIETGYRYSMYFSYLPHDFIRDYHINYTDRQVKHFENIYDVYSKYKNYALKNEKESIDFFPKNNNLKLREPEFVSQLLGQLLSSLNKKDQLACECKYYEPLAKNQLYVFDYIVENNTNNKKMDFDYFTELTTQILPFDNYEKIENKCAGSTTFKFYEDYIEKLHKTDVYDLYNK